MFTRLFLPDEICHVTKGLNSQNLGFSWNCSHNLRCLKHRIMNAMN